MRRSSGLQELKRYTVCCRQAGFMMLPLTLKGGSVCLVPANYFAWPAPVHVHDSRADVSEKSITGPFFVYFLFL